MSTPPRTIPVVETPLPATLPRPDAIEVGSASPSPVRSSPAGGPLVAQLPPSAAEVQPQPPAFQFPAAGAGPQLLKYMGAPVQSAYLGVGQFSVFSALEGDINIEPIPEEEGLAAVAEGLRNPVEHEARSNDDSIYGVPPAAVPAAAPAPAAPAPQGGKRRATGRRRLLSGPRRTARRRAFSRNRRYTYPQLI